MIRIYLSRLLGERRWTQHDLSQLTAIRPATIHMIYNEYADRVSFDHLDRICEALNCTLPDLIEYIPNTIQRTGEYLIDDTLHRRV